jgi:hemolysin activation/secretion protein
VEVLGNTVLQAEIDKAIAPYQNRPASFEELIALRSTISQLYVENGYITSGAFLPNNQDLGNGIVRIQVVEGKLERLQLSGLTRLRQEYVRDRLELATGTPLNQRSLEKALQLLQLNPLIGRVDAELTVGSSPGLSVLLVDLQEAPPLHVGIGADNSRSPSIGELQARLDLSHDNLLGFGDRLSSNLGITEGLKTVDLNYDYPLNARDGTLRFGFDVSDSRIVQDEFEDLDIKSDTYTLSLGFRQPIIKTPNTELAVELAFDRRWSNSFLEGEPFSFSQGPDDGEARVSAIRFSQDWVRRGTQRVLAARSQLNFGVGLFDATLNDTGPSGDFFSWLGQFQWVEQLPARLLLVSRVNTQLTADSLLSLEKFSLGGVDTVRGYAQNQLVADSGINSSVELRVPLTEDSNILQLSPFVEVGNAWNNDEPNPDPATLLSTGLGVRWFPRDDLGIRLDYGFPLISVDRESNSLQENGFHFSLNHQFQ